MAAIRPMAVANRASAIEARRPRGWSIFSTAMAWKACHDPPDRAEQADEGRGGGDDGQRRPGRSPTLALSRAMVVSSARSMRWIRKAVWVSADQAPARASRHSLQSALQHAGQGVGRPLAGVGGDVLERAARAPPGPRSRWPRLLSASGARSCRGSRSRTTARPGSGPPSPASTTQSRADEQVDEAEALGGDRCGVHAPPGAPCRV